MLNKALTAVLLALCVTASFAAPIATAGEAIKTEVQHVGRQQRAESWENTRYGVDAVQCDGVSEPIVPTALPEWATRSAEELARDSLVEELYRLGTFVRGSEVVIKRCNPDALDAAVEYVNPRPAHGVPDPTFDIFFDCGDGDMYRIYVNAELEFGTGPVETRGTFRLLAPNFNIELNGSYRHRIIRVNKNAHLTVFGLRFQHGSRVNNSWQIDYLPSGGWNGGAILVSFSGSLVAYKCKFQNNVASSRYVRYGSGGAIQAETDAYLLVWDCLFRFNHGTNAGAIGASSAREVNIVRTTFYGNVGHGGYDGTKTIQVNGSSLSIVTIRSGAMRVDSVTGHASSDEHVTICNSVFRNNRIVFTREELAEFGYAESEVEHLRAGAAALSVWNKEGRLDIENNDVNMLTVKGCIFDRNYEELPWEHFRMGMFVLEAECAGHIDISDVSFTRNRVQDSVCRIDNSDRFGRDAFALNMTNIEFRDNGEVRTLRFHQKHYGSRCELLNVDGFRDGSGHCMDFLSE